MINTVCKLLVLSQLQRIRVGRVVLEDKKIYVFGDQQSEISVHVKINQRRFYRYFVLGGELGAAESYIYGDWECESLADLFRIIVLNQSYLVDGTQDATMRKNPIKLLKHKFSSNTLQRGKKHVMAHYDLGNDFFQLFLDKTLMYSCAIYPDAKASLEQAQMHKLKLICRKLALKNDDHVCEIGSGWGSFAIYAAQYYGCQVTTTTISDAQYHYVKEKVEQLGLANQITVLNQDYRLLDGKYDKIVSIEMIEAVGRQFFEQFFHKCQALLKPQGRMCLQAITINDDKFDQYSKNIDFINTYIFPGGCLPSVRVIQSITNKQDCLRIAHIEDIGHHYAQTLQDWLHNFNNKINEITQLGFGLSFIRTWHYYFHYCIGGFLSENISNVQIILERSAE